MKIGLIVNPVAGVGGPAGLKGSDGAEIQKLAFERGSVRLSGFRTETFLNSLRNVSDKIMFYCGPGEMGERVLEKTSFEYEVVGEVSEIITSSEDTEKTAEMMLEKGVELLLFAGGDGTARNVFNAVGDKIPVLGIPAGVKIHSGVFAASPAAAAKVTEAFVNSKVPVRQAEVIDLDEDAYRNGVIGDTLYGYMNVPSVKSGIQNAKAASHNDENDVAGITEEIKSKIESSERDVCYIVGAGSTMHSVKTELFGKGSLLGVDVYKNGECIAEDCSSRQLYEIAFGNQCRIIVTAIGGQGHIFGRGNQQLSPDVIRAVGKSNIIIAACASKIYGLENQTLIVDTGDSELDEELRGYSRVIIGWQEYLICKII